MHVWGKRLGSKWQQNDVQQKHWACLSRSPYLINLGSNLWKKCYCHRNLWTWVSMFCLLHWMSCPEHSRHTCRKWPCSLVKKGWGQISNLHSIKLFCQLLNTLFPVYCSKVRSKNTNWEPWEGKVSALAMHWSLQGERLVVENWSGLPWNQAKCPDYWDACGLISGENLYYKVYTQVVLMPHFGGPD